MLILETLADAALARLVAANFAGGNIEKHRDPPTEDDDLPLASLTYENDTGTADGDSRTGIQDFVHKATFTVDILDWAPTGAELMAKLAIASETVMVALIAGLATWDCGVIEGIGGVRQVTEKSPKGARIVYRRQIQIDVLYRSQWEPSTADLETLAGVDVDTGLDAPDDAPGIGTSITVPTE